MTPTRVALVGDDREIAEQLVRVLIERGFELEGLRVLGPDDQQGEVVEVDDSRLRVDRADSLSLAGAEAVLFFGAADLAKELSDLVPDGVVTLDAARAASDRTGAVPVVPEVNAELIGSLGRAGVVPLASPATVGLAVALAPLHDAARVRRVITTVLYPASVAGRAGIERLSRQSVELMQGRSLEEEIDPEHFAFNLRPHRGSDAFPFSAEEGVLGREFSAIFGDPPVEILATGVQAPVFYGIAQSVYVETEEALDVDEAERHLLRGKGLLVAGSTEPSEDQVVDPSETPIEEVVDLSPGPVEVAGSDAVHVSHVRADPYRDHGLAFWLALDDQRKGVALNAIAALEIALRDAHA